MEEILSQYLLHLNIPISKDYCNKLITSHPDYPSLLSLADTMDRLGIEHQIGRIDEDHLDAVSFPYIIFTEADQGDLYLVKNEQELTKLKDSSILNYWKGLVLKVEPQDTITDEGNNKKYKSEQLLKGVSFAVAAALMGLSILSVIQVFSISYVALVLTVVIGLGIGYVLFGKEVGIKYKAVESFCNTNTRTNCDRILNSETATLFGFFSLSEAAFSYFLFQFAIAVLLFPFVGSNSLMWVLAVSSTLAVPVIIFSIYYQALVAKTWCKLCLGVSAVLIAQLVHFALQFGTGSLSTADLQVVPFIAALFVFIPIASFLIVIKSRLLDANEAMNSLATASGVKYNMDVFAHLLMKERRIAPGLFQEKELIIGNKTASVELTMAANLNCYPCHVAYHKVIQLVNMYPQHVRLSLRLTESRNLISSISASSYLIRYWEHYIYGTEQESDKTKLLLSSWYDAEKRKAIAQTFPLKTEELEKKGSEEKHYDWMQQAGITHTPTFFVNGYELPKKYNVEDLMVMLPSLVDFFGIMNSQKAPV